MKNAPMLSLEEQSQRPHQKEAGNDGKTPEESGLHVA
jgi:hypothetical protein